MNYIQEINAFYEWLETNTMPRAAIALWNALMNVNNRTMWQGSFEVAMSTLETKTGCSRKELYSARVILAEKGRITWQPRGGHLSAVYTLIPFAGTRAQGASAKAQNNVGFTGDSDPDGDSGREPEKILQGNTNRPKTENETQNKGEEDSSLSTGVDGAVSASLVLDEYNRVCTRLPRAKHLTPKRTKAVRARVREHGGPEVLKMLALAGESDFLAGHNQSNWTATFDWLLLPTNFVKVLEGNYSNKPAKYFQNKPSPFEVIEETYNNILNNGTFDY